MTTVDKCKCGAFGGFAHDPATCAALRDADLDCGHDTSCLRQHEGENFCGWCNEIKDNERLRDENHKLREAFHKNALIVMGGTVRFAGEIGLLEIHGGEFHQERP